MNNDLTVFNRFPPVFPTGLEEDIPSSIFDVFDKLFDTPKFRRMSVYPVNVYEKRVNDVLDSIVIEIATAGINKDKCKVKVDGNKLYVNIGYAEVPVPDDEKKDELKETKKSKKVKAEEETEVVEPKITKRYIQKQIAERSSYMSWTLSNQIDKKNIDVKYIDGVLTINLPFIKEAQCKDVIDLEIQ